MSWQGIEDCTVVSLGVYSDPEDAKLVVQKLNTDHNLVYLLTVVIPMVKKKQPQLHDLWKKVLRPVRHFRDHRLGCVL